MVHDIHTATWLSTVPQHWKTLRIKNLFAEIDERSETGEEELLSVSHYTGVTKKRDSLENEDDFISNAKTLVGYKKVAENDLVSNIMLAWNGSLGISKYEGITSPAYCVYRIKGDNNPHYYGYLFSTAIMKAEFRKKSFGIIDSRLRLYSDKFFSIPVTVPPKDEQDQIVNYIKAKSKKIKHFIQKKQAFIELLKEQRQAVISKAVTKGINPDVTLKDSGIQWLGDIPEHWGIRRLKFCLEEKLKYGANESGFEYNPDWYRYIRITDFSKGGILSEENKLFLPVEIGKEYELKDGDILFARSGATVGKTYQFKKQDDSEKYCYAGYLIKATPDGEIVSSDFLMLYSESLAFENWKNSIFNKATIENIGADKYSVLPITIPPKEEQADIIQFIKAETAKIDQTIAKAEKEIELIKEYREAMIAEAVFGKLDIKVHTKKKMEHAK